MSQNRRLAAIMVGDIVGFTAEMAIDEAHALSYVRRMRSVAEPLVRRWEGRLIKHIGDGFLVAFDSAVEAVDCAVAIQRALAAEPDFKLRLGVHLGDVLFGDDDVFGDGVNVAARLEMLALPGGICVSQNVWELVRNQTGVVGTLIGQTTIPPGGIEAWAVAGEGMPRPSARGVTASHSAGLAHKVAMAGSARRIVPVRSALALAAAAAAGALLAFVGLQAGGWLSERASFGSPAPRLRVLVVDIASPRDAGPPADPAAAQSPSSGGEGGAAVGAAPPLSARLNALLADALGAVTRIQVVPRDQVRDDLLLLRAPPDAPVDPELARRIAERDPSIDGIAVGSIDAIGGGFVLRVEIIDPRSGEVLASVHRDADGEAQLLGAMRHLLDAAASALPGALAALPERGPEADPAWSRVTTDNAEALADYRAAHAQTVAGDWRAALALAERAVEADPAFAMGHLLAAEANRALGRDVDGGTARARAAALVGALERPVERELVRAGLLRARGACRDAAASLGVVAKEAPEAYRAYSHWTLTSLAGALACAGRVGDALAEQDALAAAMPEDPLPRAAALDLRLRFAGDVAGARQAWRRLDRLAPARPPDGMLLFPAIESWANDRTAEASSALEALRAERGEDDVLPIRIALYQASLAAYDGQFDRALAAAREAAAIARAREAAWLEAYARVQQAAVMALAGDAAASRELLTALAEDDTTLGHGPRALLMVARARAGEDEARRFDVLVGPRLVDRRAAAAFSALVQGDLARASGSRRSAVEALEDAVAAAPELGYDDQPSWYRPAVAYEALAAAYEADGRTEEALATWRHLAARPVSAVYSASIADVAAYVRAQYHVGRLAEAAGDRMAARAATQAFLRRWGDAGVPEAASARERLARLEGGG